MGQITGSPYRAVYTVLTMASMANRRMFRKEGISTLRHMMPPKISAQDRFSSEWDRMYRLLLAAMTCSSPML